MVQPRLAYAGVVELPQEVCHLPWPDEEPLKQDDTTCDPPGEEETSEEGQSDHIPVGEEDASDGNGPVEAKATSTFNSGPDIEICFFHVEAKDPEEIDPENDDEHQHRTELAEHAVGFEEDATSSSTLATQEDERVEQGIYIILLKVQVYLLPFSPKLCEKSIPASAHTHQISIVPQTSSRWIMP